MVATLAWTRVDFTMPGWTFLGGTKLVWTATSKESRREERAVVTLFFFFFNIDYKDGNTSGLLHVCLSDGHL